jgi:hypothetical protein
MTKPFDAGSILVILVTLVLFLTALFVKGVTHDLLLEAGVFLVSVKLIIGAYKNGRMVEELRLKLEEIHSDVRRLDGRNGA